jgi:hypothetical protein
MPLSKQEQRALDEIERALRDDDPRFVNAVSFDHLRRHRALVGGSLLVLGMILLVVGEIASQAQLVTGIVVSIAGFLLMFAAIAWTIRRPYRTTANPPRQRGARR